MTRVPATVMVAAAADEIDTLRSLDGPAWITALSCKAARMPKKQMHSPEAVRSYKALAEVERPFRSMKTLSLIHI